MITIRALEAARGPFRLHVPELAIGRGLTLLTGRNGSGKSTLLNILSTAWLPDRGGIDYDGLSLAESRPILRSRIGFLPSGLELHEDMTAEKFLRYMGELKGIYDQEPARTLLEEMDLTSLRRRRIRELSQGQRQKLALAQALLGQPAYLFLDEPLTFLDSGERRQVVSWLGRYALRRHVVVSSHELNEWEPAESILWLNEGGVLFHGPAEEWGRDLPLSVWTGTVNESEWADLSQELVMGWRQVPGGREVRVMAPEPPASGFVPADPTREDAYFIRRYVLRESRTKGE
ncbi:ABC transporter ATP-binding protein [Paenibacillus aurantius]|uniref:ABC transporter ATP-binding protein n=1 Tax=Paenibacillus aurantius TaxID=2918900 RepID=A0AA96RF77_9BACL|nr:ABC transporter ATP-binding protein [Paenibacillus aurantius]WNQ11171.1 ABC transporter ATP-binding protein [Paenibacillus aurantius]